MSSWQHRLVTGKLETHPASLEMAFQPFSGSPQKLSREWLFLSHLTREDFLEEKWQYGCLIALEQRTAQEPERKIILLEF